MVILEYIPAPLEDARFRKFERFIIKAHFLLSIPLKRNVTQSIICSTFPQGAGLETLYTALLISTIE
ncbi:hypothetical protein CXF79_01870 [Colwellia sp. Bg11-28]|nr:hypothetical protein CXF79_01870 [Colwellia sp. Bg11-28]